MSEKISFTALINKKENFHIIKLLYEKKLKTKNI